MDTEFWSELAAGVALLGLMAYAILGGADFGGGVWDLFATGTRQRKQAQRSAIAAAMGPVWEANHVWLIFTLVVLFTCFPRGYAALSVALFVPFHLALVGIILRGASFIFRGFMVAQTSRKASQEAGSGAPARIEGGAASAWGLVFGIASVISPLFLGAAFGAVTSGDIRVDAQGHVTLAQPLPWLGLYPIGCGLLALSSCAYLAAVYLVAETRDQLREEFHRRAIIAGSLTAVLAATVLVLAYFDAPWFFAQLFSPRSLPALGAGLISFGASAWAVFQRRYVASRIFAAGEIVLLLLGWGLAHQPYLVYPDLTLAGSAAPTPTIQFLLLSLPVGLLFLVPSLWFLFAVFKSKVPEDK